MGDVYRFNCGYPLLGDTLSTLAMDTLNEAVAGQFVMPVDDTITHVIFSCSSKTGTPANDTYTVSLQGLDATGLPDGTILGGASPASATYPNATYPASGFGSNTGHVIALANSIALQRGTAYMLVNQRTGATDAANYLTLHAGRAVAGGVSAPGTFYALTADATPTWTKQIRLPHGILGLRSATRTYFFPSTFSGQSQSFGSTTETGFTFTLPSSFGTSNSYGVMGVRVSLGSTFSTGGTYVVTLYGTPLGTPSILQQTTTLDSDHLMAGALRGLECFFPEDTLAALVPGTKYGIGIAHSAASGGSVSTIVLPDANCRDAYPLGGLTFATRTLTDYPPSANDTAAFTETTTRIVAAELILGDFTAAAGTTIAGTPMRRGMI